MLRSLSGKNAFFISLDLKQGYLQAPLTKHSQHLSAFVTPLGQYEYTRLPFGVMSAPAEFQQQLELILGDTLYTRALVYIDDILIFGCTFQELIENLEIVLQRLQVAGAVLALAKSVFLATEVQFLGVLVGKDYIKPNLETTAAIRSFAKPASGKEMQRFLGLANYQRPFAARFQEYEQQLRPLCATRGHPANTQAAGGLWQAQAPVVAEHYPVLVRP